jgi:peptidoglycan/xylan/chitin deacetylase (PgdA/CDA1 family)
MIHRAPAFCISLLRHKWRHAHAIRGASPNHVVVLRYGGVRDSEAEHFYRHVTWLAAHTEVVATMTHEQRAPQTHTQKHFRVALTFDCAFENLIRNAVPLLRQLHLPATFFAVSANLGRKPQWPLPRRHPDAEEMLMSEGQLTALPKDLFEIGSHTATHARLGRLSRTELRSELLNSKNDLEQALGRPVTGLSIPYGEWTLDAVDVAAEAGYRHLYSDERHATRASLDSGIVHRVSTSPTDWFREFQLKALGAYVRGIKREKPPRRPQRCSEAVQV